MRTNEDASRSSDVAIFGRLIRADNGNLSRELARYILTIGFEQADQARSCLNCNSRKGPNIAGRDPVTKKLTKLFNPRRHKWERHFRWNGSLLLPRTAVGRVTILVLALNDPDLIAVRKELIEEGVFP